MNQGILKYRNLPVPGRQDGEQVMWSRVTRGLDSYPFVGKGLPMLKESEWEEATYRSADFKYGVFDLLSGEDYWAQTDSGAKFYVYSGLVYAFVMERIANHWFSRVFQDREFFKPSRQYVYLEWIEYYIRGKMAEAPV